MSTDRPFGEALQRMVAPPPGPKSREYAARLRKVEFPVCSTIGDSEVPVFWQRALGANVQDVDGNVYIDLTAGFTVAVAGHSNPTITRVIGEQAQRLMHSQGGANPNPWRVELAEELAAFCPGDLSVTYISTTGAEAVDIALKTARLYTGRHTVIAFHHGFHGKTTGALAVTSINYYREPFVPVLVGTTHIPYAYCYRCVWDKQYPSCGVRCADYLEYVLSMPDSGISNVAAVIMEPVQGHGGWIVPPPEFGQKVRDICSRHGVLLISDEIITGFGRVGHRFGIDYHGVVPDIVVMGKGLASGFPISAIVTRPEIAAAWKPMQHSSTFVGNPLGCAAALACLGEIENRQLIQRSQELGRYFKNALVMMQERYQFIGDVRGLGMMVGIEFVKDRQTKEPASALGEQLVNILLRKGVMATNYGGTYHNVLKMSPPLVITKEQLDEALRILDDSLAEVAGLL